LLDARFPFALFCIVFVLRTPYCQFFFALLLYPANLFIVTFLNPIFFSLFRLTEATLQPGRYLLPPPPPLLWQETGKLHPLPPLL
jgi:hypothetical protein